MEPTTKFLLFMVFSAASLAGGYLWRKRHPGAEKWSRPIHLHTVAWLWSAVSLFAFWQLPINSQVLLIMSLQPVLMVGAWRVTVLWARRRRWPDEQTAVCIIGASLTNQGFTMGAFLCYCIFDEGALAMSYAIAFVTSMQVFQVLIFYPVTRYYHARIARAGETALTPTLSQGERGPVDDDLAISVPRLIASSFVDIRSMPLYASAAGAILSAMHMPAPGFLETTPALDVLFFAGAMTSYIGIGLRLRLGDSRRYLQHHAAIGAVKFVFMPALAWMLLWLLGRAGGGVDPLPAGVVLVESAMPAAIATVIVPNLFHLDARMASVLWLWNTIAFAALVLPVVLWVT